MEQNTSKKAGDHDTVTHELAHIIWYLKTGEAIEDQTELHEAWKNDFLEAHTFAQKVIQHMYSRGMTVSYYDKDLSHFAKS